MRSRRTLCTPQGIVRQLTSASLCISFGEDKDAESIGELRGFSRRSFILYNVEKKIKIYMNPISS